MADATRIEHDLLGLPPAERERLLMRVWGGLAKDPSAAGDPELDPEGIRMALKRDEPPNEGSVRALTEEEFLRRTDSLE